MRFVALLLLIACAPSTPHTSEGATVLIGGDDAAVARVVRRPVVSGGLWFADPACASEFSAPAEIAEAQLARFAHCLAQLHVSAGARRSELDDTILTYGPGIEIAARFRDDAAQGPLLTWIGFSSLHAGPPTISSDDLERLRTSGARDGALDAATGGALVADAHQRLGANVAGAWLELCLDQTGAIAKLHVADSTSIAAGHAFEAIARTWTFRPFLVAGAPIPVCALVQTVYPTSKHPAKEKLPALPPADELPTVSAKALGERLDGATTIIPTDSDKVRLLRAGIEHVIVSYRYCIDETGAVFRVTPIRISGLAEYDARIVDTIHGWRFAPYREGGAPARVCTLVTFNYHQR